MLPVIVFAFIISFFNSVVFIAGYLLKPPGTVFLSPVHYFEDYFFYLNHFFQGAHGAWLTVNRYTSEPTAVSIIYWCNVILGKIGSAFMLPPVVSYNLSVPVLAVMLLVLSYVLVRRVFPNSNLLSISALIISALSTSLINRVDASSGGKTWWPFQIWRTPHFAFDRLGGAPHQMLQTIFSYVFLISATSKPGTRTEFQLKIMCMIFSSVLLTSLNPVQGAVFITLWLSAKLIHLFLYQKQTNSGFLLSAVSGELFTVILNLPIFIYMLYATNQMPHLQSKIWEAGQHSYTTIPFLILSIGPVFPLALTGLLMRIKKLTALELFGVFLISLGYFMFLTRIPQTVGFSNLRILFPAMYPFYGIFASWGIYLLASRIKNILNFPVAGVVIITVSLFIIISLPTLIWEVNQKLSVLNNPRDPMLYLPKDIYEGFNYLSLVYPLSDIVIANPDSHMDLLVPALSGHTTYSGHFLVTIDNDRKKSELDRIFNLHLKTGDLFNFLKTKNIKYIIFTRYDGNLDSFTRTYPDLKTIFRNNGISIFTLN